MDGSTSRNGFAAEDSGDERPLKVLKFGGSSLVTAARIRLVVEIVREASRTHRLVVVVSAVGKTTDRLVELIDASDPAIILEQIRGAHLELSGKILSREGSRLYDNDLDVVLDALPPAERTPACRDRILSAGERLSVPLLALALREAGVRAEPVDATALIRTDDSFGSAQVDVEETNRLVRTWHSGRDRDIVAVVTGFIGSTASGEVTTLGRGGSDYSAALIAGALGAAAFERWTDVDGLYTMDPRENDRARKMTSMALTEALTWNRAGRLGMHRKALDPIMAASIPVYVRSTMMPEHTGTVIMPPEAA